MSDDKEFRIMAELLEEVESILPKVDNWLPHIRSDLPEDARAFVGSYDGWKLVIVDFDIENQGFPPGSR